MLLLIKNNYCGNYTNMITIHNCKLINNIYYQRMIFEGFKDIYTRNESMGIVLVDINLALCKDKFSNVVLF